VLALALTLSGMYGVLSYLVALQTREIGIRMALGATISRVVATIFLQSFQLAAIGSAAGVALALIVSRLLASLLEGFNTFDSLAYSVGPTAVLIAAATAAFVPSRRAARVQPSITLRCD